MTIKKKSKPISKARIYRAVASSTAIETNEPIDVIERRLKQNQTKFEHLKLAL